MKKKLINILFKIVDFLSDKTNGFSLFSKWKIALGSLLIGATISACRQQTACYEPLPIDDISSEDTIAKINNNGATTTPTTKTVVAKKASSNMDEPEIYCYEVTFYDTTASKTPISIEDTAYYNQIFTEPEARASFPGGEAKKLEFIQQNNQLPRTTCYESAVTGKVYVQFIVQKDGTIDDIKILRSIGNRESEEAVRIIKSMPNWIPAKQNGYDVASYYAMPIKFEL